MCHSLSRVCYLTHIFRQSDLSFRYYEWLTKGKDKLPHFIKRKDNRLLLMAGLYDSVVLEGETVGILVYQLSP